MTTQRQQQGLRNAYRAIVAGQKAAAIENPTCSLNIDPDGYQRCGQPAVRVLQGRYPRCAEHAPKEA